MGAQYKHVLLNSVPLLLGPRGIGLTNCSLSVAGGDNLRDCCFQPAEVGGAVAKAGGRITLGGKPGCPFRHRGSHDRARECRPGDAGRIHSGSDDQAIERWHWPDQRQTDRRETLWSVDEPADGGSCQDREELDRTIYVWRYLVPIRWKEGECEWFR